MIFINNLDPVLFEYGALSVRWYGLLFAIGILLNYLILQWVFRREKFRTEDLDSLVLYLFFGLLIGARLGHILFYNFAFFMANPMEILKVWNGGLASHGAAIGLFLAYSLWAWMRGRAGDGLKKTFVKYADTIVLPMPLTAAFVRVGNFFNSEIVGVATGKAGQASGANGEAESFGVIFQRLGEDFARHPAQLYEGAASLLIFFVLIFIYKKYGKKLPQLFLFFFYIFWYFVARFIVEFYKDQAFLADVNFGLTRGQWLSLLPIAIAAGYFIWLTVRKLKNKF